MADIAVVGLELQTDKLAQQARQAEDALKRVEAAGDRVGQSQRKASQSVSSTEREIAKAARENAAYAQALARLQRATGDYDGAIKTLEIHLKSLTSTSSAYVRVQAQIAQIQAQQGRAARGENFAGFAQGFKNIEAQIQNLPGRFGTVTARVQNATNAISQFAGISSQGAAIITGLTVGIAALGVGAAVAAKQIFDLSAEGAKLADELNDASRITGISVGQLSLIKTAAAQGGSSLGEFQNAAALFGSKLEEVAQGKLPRLAGALKAFGIDAKKGIEEPEKAIIEFGKALVTIEDPILRVALAREAMGRNGAKLIPLFDALNATTATSGRITDDVARAAGALDDKLAGVSDRAADAKIQIASLTAGSIIQGIDAMGIAFESLASGLNKVAESRGLKVLPLLSLFFSQVRPGAIGDALITGGGGSSTPRTVSNTPSRASLLSSTPVSDLVRSEIANASTRTVRSGGAARALPPFEFKESSGLTAVVQGLKDTIEAAAKLGRQSLPELEKSLLEARFDVDTLSQVLKVLPPTHREYAATAEALNRALVQVNVAEQKRVELLNATRLPTRFAGQLNTEDVFKRLPLEALPPGVIPSNKTFDDFFAPWERRRPGELIGLGEQFGGRNDPQTGERIRGAGELIAQDFITGALMGQADARRAGEQIAFFVADYFARKLTDALREALDPVFDAIGDAITGLFKNIVGKIGGAIGGGLGGIFGGLFRAGGGPVTAGAGYVVGESGREWFVPQTNGFIVNQQQAAAAVAGGAGGGGMVVHMNFNIQAPDGRVDRRSIDQVSENAAYALHRARRNAGA